VVSIPGLTTDTQDFFCRISIRDGVGSGFEMRSIHISDLTPHPRQGFDLQQWTTVFKTIF
jgi:hypothetical protein